jgi:hypothetical protein
MRVAMLAALCGLAAAADPGPGECKDVADYPWNPNYHTISKCCVNANKDAPMVWCVCPLAVG